MSAHIGDDERHRDRPQSPSARRVAAGRHRFLCCSQQALPYLWNETLGEEVRGKFFVGCFQIFRDDPSLSDHGNKVGVAFPARNDMEMQMTGNTSSRTFPHIESYIEAIGLVYLLQNLLALTGQGQHLSQFGAGCVGECGHMPVGNHQQVACRVGESIQNKEGVLLAKKNETLPILIRGGKKAKDTVRFLATRGEVMEAPGSP